MLNSFIFKLLTNADYINEVNKEQDKLSDLDKCMISIIVLILILFILIIVLIDNRREIKSLEKEINTLKNNQ